MNAAVTRRLSREHAVWLLNVAVAASAGALLMGMTGEPAVAEPNISWLAVAALIAITERWPVNLEFQRSAHSFSLTDIPLAIGLLFLGPLSLVAAVVLGSAVALAGRRLPPIKFAFNLAQFAMAAAVGLVVLHAIAGDEAGFGPLHWIGVAVATQVGGLLTIALLSCVIRLADGSLSRQQVRDMVRMDAVVSATNTSLAIVLTVVLVHEPAATPVLVVPVAVVALLYRAFIVERQRHEKLEFLYEANRTLSSEPEIDEALEGLLARAAEAFRSEYAEVALFGEAGARSMVLTNGEGAATAAVAEIEAFALRDFALAHGGIVRQTRPFPTTVGSQLERRGIESVMIAVLRGEERIVGTLLLANRVGLGRAFSEDDLALFETLAANASSALQYDRLEQAVSDLRLLQDRLHHQAHHDSLTGLANRMLFYQDVRQAVSHATDDEGVAVLFLDLDDFKGVNDTLGHAVGDELLLAAAERLRHCIRDGDTIARLGGDEFAVRITGPGRIEDLAVEVAERVAEAFALPVAVADRLLSVRLSVGIATTHHSGGRTEDLLRDADVAMYEAKGAGKARHAVFDPTMREGIMRRHDLRDRLERAIEDDELLVHYQPIVDLTTGATTAVEALVRWEQHDRGLVPPGEFIPLAEETGLIVPLGRFVLNQACRQGARWASQLPAHLVPKIHVNLSALELEDPEIVASVRSALESSGLAPELLVLEITETLMMQDAVRGAVTLDQLQALDVGIALDDFGTGYSSLSYLRSLPLDVLKIAKEFVDGLATNPEDEAFIRLIIGLAQTIGLCVVVEGVETAAQTRMLRDLGADLGQGYYFSRPVAPEALFLGAGSGALVPPARTRVLQPATPLTPAPPAR